MRHELDDSSVRVRASQFSAIDPGSSSLRRGPASADSSCMTVSSGACEAVFQRLEGPIPQLFDSGTECIIPQSEYQCEAQYTCGVS
jgi:hypothetical protein